MVCFLALCDSDNTTGIMLPMIGRSSFFFLLIVGCATSTAMFLKKPLFAIWWATPVIFGGVIIGALTDTYLLSAFMEGSEAKRLTIKMLVFPVISWMTITLRRSFAYRSIYC